MKRSMREWGEGGGLEGLGIICILLLEEGLTDRYPMIRTGGEKGIFVADSSDPHGENGGRGRRTGRKMGLWRDS